MPNSFVWGAMSSVLVTATRKPKTMRPHAAGRHRLRVGDHEEEEDEHLGREEDHPPVVEPAHWRERPPRHHGMAGRGEEPEAGREREPERDRGGEEPETRGDEQPADQDHRVGDDHPGAEGRPPEVEWLDAGAAEHDEDDDEPDVRRVEDVRAPVPDEVLGRERECRDAREHAPGVRSSNGRRQVCSAPARSSATPLPVSIALAGQTNDRSLGTSSRPRWPRT